MSTNVIRPDMADVEKLAVAMRVAPDIVQDELRGFVSAVTNHMQKEVTDRVPTTHGTLRASIIGNFRPLPGLGFEGVVGTSLSYAIPVELGTKPHMPPVQPLVEWARQKLGVSGKEAERAGWGIARKIARQGTKGHFMFADAFSANEAQVVSGFGECVSRIERRIAADGSAKN